MPLTAGEPSDESELQSRTQGSGSSVVGKEGTKVIGSFPDLKSPDTGRTLPERIKIPVYHTREKRGAVSDRERRLTGALWLLLSFSVVRRLLPPSPPFLQSGDRRADRWTRDIRTQERGGGWEERRERGEEGERGEPGGERRQRRGNNNSGCQIQSVSPRG